MNANMMTKEEQNNWVSQQLEKYATVPWRKDAGIPQLLVKDDFNAQTIIGEMQKLYPWEALTIQRVIDFIRGPFGSCLHWTPDPKYKAPQQPTAPATPQPKRDGRSREQKLQDAGIMPITYKKTAEDVVEDKARRAAEREKMKALFTNDPKRTEFDRKLHDVNVYIEIVNGRINRATTNRVKEQMRVELRKQYPQFSELLKQPESERDVKW